MAISQFKARCLAVLEQVRRTRKPVLVTRFGVPMAEIVPPRPSERKADWIGRMRGTGEIKGDIIAPASDESDWDVLRS